MLRRLVVLSAVLAAAVTAPAAARPVLPHLPWVPPFDDRITWYHPPTYTYEFHPQQSRQHWYRIRSSFRVDGLEPIDDQSQVLVSYRRGHEFVSAGLAAPVFCTGDGLCSYTTAFPVESFPAPGTYTVNSVCRSYSDGGASKCRPAYADEAVDLVIPAIG